MLKLISKDKECENTVEAAENRSSPTSATALRREQVSAFLVKRIAKDAEQADLEEKSGLKTAGGRTGTQREKVD